MMWYLFNMSASYRMTFYLFCHPSEFSFRLFLIHDYLSTSRRMPFSLLSNF